MTDLEDLQKKIVIEKNLDPATAIIASQCMIELCQQCNMKKQFARLGSLFENLTDGVIVFDLNFNVLDMNKLGENINKHFKTFYYKEKSYRINNLPVLEEAVVSKAYSPITIEVTSFDQFGYKHAFNVGCSLVFSEANVLIGTCLIISDITEIQKQARQLEDIVSALTHDLKTPLVAAETSLKHILGGYFGGLTKEQKQILSLLVQSNSDALRLVKNLLSVFKYETKSYKLLLEPIEISILLERAIDVIKPLLNEKKVSLKRIESSFIFVCDPFEIERVIVNLLTNATKYTPSGGRIEMLAVKKEDGNVIISIEDTGAGIAIDDLPNLFARFWQSRKSNSSSNSTGLGLYLSRQIVEAHSGKIWVESEFEKGTKVSFEIPAIS